MLKSAKILDGASLAAKIRQELKKKVYPLKNSPTLAAVLVGDDVASKLYLKLKTQACDEVGILFYAYRLSAKATELEVLSTINWLNQDTQVNGILVQLPLPPHLDEDRIISAIATAKEVDGFSQQNLVKLKKHQEIIIPGLAAGIWTLIDSASKKFSGQKAVIVAKSSEFYTAVAEILSRHKIVSQRLLPGKINQSLLSQADIVVTAVGKKGWLKAGMIKSDSIIIDVGIIKKGKKVYGDAAADCWTKAGYISPVPGGVGPLTVAYLLENTYQLYLKQRK